MSYIYIYIIGESIYQEHTEKIKEKVEEKETKTESGNLYHQMIVTL